MFSIRFRFRRSEEQRTCHFQVFGTKVLGIGNLSAWCSMVRGVFVVLGTLLSHCVWHFVSWCSAFLALRFSGFCALGTLFFYA